MQLQGRRTGQEKAESKSEVAIRSAPGNLNIITALTLLGRRRHAILSMWVESYSFSSAEYWSAGRIA